VIEKSHKCIEYIQLFLWENFTFQIDIFMFSYNKQVVQKFVIVAS
jgi:hypothetical protein